MDTTGVDGSLAGGGEILQYWGNAELYNDKSPYLDNELVKLFNTIPIVKFLIYACIIFLMVLVILKIFNIRSPFKGKGITRELDYMEKIRKHDLSILRANKLMTWITSLIEKTPFTMNAAHKEYWQYNLSRAGVKIPGGSRDIKAIEFHAIVVFITICIEAVNVLITIFFNSTIGVILMVATVILSSVMPMMVLRSTVQEKDLEIKENFSDYYLMLHYVLIANAKTPLGGIMRSYSKTTSSKEMQHYVDVCVHYIDTYGEFEATHYITKEYREIPEIGKLMRLIRQANEGGEIEAELMGFRSELLKTKQYAIEKRMNKLVAKARASFNLLMPILFQAIISAMSIYFSDMGLISTIISV